MTWKRASPVLILCGIFDLSRAFFSMFWLFGPALAAAYCTVRGSEILSSATLGVLATKTAGLFCSVGAGIAGFFLSPALVMFGAVMAMAIGLAGWLTVGLVLIMTNARIFKENASSSVSMVLGLGVSELPFLNALPVLTGTCIRLYRTQIKKEHAELKAWEAKNALIAQQRRQQQLDQLMMLQQEKMAVEEAQFEEQQAEERESEEEDARLDEEEENEAEQDAEDASGEMHRGSREGEGGDGVRRGTRESRGTGGGDARSGRTHSDGITVVDDNQFDTMSDALSQLNSKQNRTPEENEKLTKARKIMETHSIDATERDPVLRAAYERAEMGQKVFDGTNETRNGFVFSNSKSAGMARGASEWR